MIEQIRCLGFAHIDSKASILAKGYPEDNSITIGCFAYYIEKDGKKILVDLGIEDIDTVNLTKTSKDMWQRGRNEYSLLDNLKKINVCADDIDYVFITHSHYDHISGLKHLKNAQIVMSDAEYNYLLYGDNPHRKFLSDVIELLEKANSDGRLTLVENRFCDDDISCVVLGGHTAGSMMVYIEDFLFTGDNLYLIDTIEKAVPIGFCNEPKNAQKALKLCMEHKGRVLTGHDLNCYRELEEDV